MKPLIKPFLCLVLALMLLLTAGCTQKSDIKSFVLMLDGVVQRGGVILEGITPGMSKEEAQAAGLAFGAEPFRTSDDESGRSSESYPAKNAISLDKTSFKAPEFQFMNGKLVDITMTTTAESGAASLLNQLKKELGEPKIQTAQINSTDSTEVQFWESDQGEYLLRIAYLTRYRSGEAVGANLQVAYVYYEWFPEYKK